MDRGAHRLPGGVLPLPDAGAADCGRLAAVQFLGIVLIVLGFLLGYAAYRNYTVGGLLHGQLVPRS